MPNPPVFDGRSWMTTDGDVRLGLAPDVTIRGSAYPATFDPSATPPRYGVYQQARRDAIVRAPESGRVLARWTEPAGATAATAEPPWNVGGAGLAFQGASGWVHVIGNLSKVGLPNVGDAVSERAELGRAVGPWVYWRVGMSNAPAASTLRDAVVDPLVWLLRTAETPLGPEPGTNPPPAPPAPRASSGGALLVLVVILLLAASRSRR